MTEFDINFVAAFDLMLNVGWDNEGWERLDLWQPADRNYVSVAVSIRIGMIGMYGTNDFSLEICTRALLAKEGSRWKPEYVLVVEDFDWTEIKPMIKARIDACRRETWDESVEELRKHFYWEYESNPPTITKPRPIPANIFPKLPKKPPRDSE